LISFKDDLSTKQQKTNEIKPVFVFVIDEINRGEISKIFGELFFSIDPSYRGKNGAVKTQYSNLHSDDKEVFYIPDNVYIIGSMNDIDRSVESFDFAMRRRFTWIEISAEQSADNMNLPEEAKGKMAKLNEQISRIEGLNPSYHIGAAYFLDSNGNVRQDYDNIWNLRIEPLLKEYLRGMPDSFDKIELLKKAFTA
jgi:5-methylcytosine-specific restriction protein B